MLFFWPKSDSGRKPWTIIRCFDQSLRGCFQVDAVVLKLTPHVAPLVRADFTTLETVVKALFQYRRKVIRKGAQ